MVTRNNDQYEQLKKHGYLGEEIITGEGVALELPAATAAARFVSGAIDWCVNALVLVALLFTISFNSDLFSFATLQASITISIAFSIWLLPTLITGLSHGNPLGKLATHTRIVRSDGGVITIRHAMIRATAGIAEIWLTQGALAFLVVIFSKRGQRVGDMLADTYVVRWPKKTNYQLNISMPQSMQAWAETARIRDIPGGLTLNIANHFKASAALTPEARLAEARTLAAAAEQYVTPAPPWGTSPEDFLAATLTLRNHLEFVRTAASRERQERTLAAVNRLP